VIFSTEARRHVVAVYRYVARDSRLGAATIGGSLNSSPITETQQFCAAMGPSLLLRSSRCKTDKNPLQNGRLFWRRPRMQKAHGAMMGVWHRSGRSKPKAERGPQTIRTTCDSPFGRYKRFSKTRLLSTQRQPHSPKVGLDGKASGRFRHSLLRFLDHPKWTPHDSLGITQKRDTRSTKRKRAVNGWGQEPTPQTH